MVDKPIFGVIEAMTNADNTEYADLYNQVRATALFQCARFKNENQAAKEAYELSASSGGVNNLASAIAARIFASCT